MTTVQTIPDVRSAYELGGCTFLGFWVRDHWPQDQFMAGLRRSEGEEAVTKAQSECKRYRHTYARVVGDWSEGYYTPVLKLDAKQGRGAFPVTVFEP